MLGPYVRPCFILLAKVCCIGPYVPAASQIVASCSQVFSQTGDLCTSTLCPWQVGPVAINQSWTFPRLAPPGPYTIQLKAWGLTDNGRQEDTGQQNEEHTELFCIKIMFSV